MAEGETEIEWTDSEIEMQWAGPDLRNGGKARLSFWIFFFSFSLSLFTVHFLLSLLFVFHVHM